MELFEQVAVVFGFSPETKELSAFLVANNIRERPEYDPKEGTPMISVEKKEDGYYLKFGMKSNFEKKRAPTVGVGQMVLEGVRLHGPLNSNGYAAFKGKLPFNLNFSQNIDEVVAKLGKPDFVSDPERPSRVMQWNNVNNFEVGTVLTPDFKHMCHLDIWPSKKQFRA